MQIRFSRAGSPESVGQIALHVVWDVDADKSHDVRPPCERSPAREDASADSPATFVAIRTREGAGRVVLEGDAIADVDEATLLIARRDAIRHYHTRGDHWHYWWFEFAASGPVHFETNRSVASPIVEGEQREFGDLFLALRRKSEEERRLASASFSRMLYGWLARREGAAGAGPHTEAILDLIDRMHSNLAGVWTVRDMAREAGMDERAFRSRFKTVTGQTPKRYYDGLRLAAAEELLSLGVYSVSEVSRQLGYSSPFHLSRQFRRRYGAPPSRYK